MNDERPPILALKQKWDTNDFARDKEEERMQLTFLEQEAKHTFAPIEDFLTRLKDVLGAAGASVEIGTWEHLDNRRLRRVAKVISSNPPRQLSLDFAIQGVTIFYRERPYRFSSGIESLIPAITVDVEQFFTPLGNRGGS